MKIKNKIIVFLLIVLTLSLLNITVYAAGSFSISAGTSMKIEGTEKLTISTIDCAGKFSISSSNSNVVSVSSSSVFVDGSVMSNPNEVILTAKSSGTAVITVTASDVSDKEYEEVTGSKYSPRGRKQSDMIEWLHFTSHNSVNKPVELFSELNEMKNVNHSIVLRV